MPTLDERIEAARKLTSHTPPRAARMSRPTACDMPGCTGPRQILLMEDAMRCVCRKCWRRMGKEPRA